MKYDPKCEELARHFAPDGMSEKMIENFAMRIQDFIEDELYDMEREAIIGSAE